MAFEEAVRLDPADPESHDALGSHFVRRGLVEQAEAEFRESLRLRDNDGWTHASLGDVLLKRGKPAEAAEELLRAASLGYDATWMQDRLTSVIRATGNVAGVAAKVLASAGQKPESAALRRRVGDVLRDAGALDDAVALYQDAVRTAPADPRGHAQLALALLYRGDLSGAAAARRQAVRLAPAALPSERLLFELARQGPWLSDPVISLMLARDQSDQRSQFIRALVRLALARDVEGYRDICRRMLRQDGDDQHVARALVLHPEAPVEPARLVELAEAAAKPDEPWTLYCLGVAQYRAGSYDAAVRTLTSATAGEWFSVPMCYPPLAMACHGAGRTGDADRWLSLAERTSLRNEGLWTDRVEMALTLAEARAVVRGGTPGPDTEFLSPRQTAAFLGALGHSDRAVKALREALRLRPLDAATHADLAVELRARGEHVASAAEAAEAERCAGDDGPLHVAVADTYAATGHWEACVAAYGRAVATAPTNHWNWYRLAAMRLAAGDPGGYRAACREMLRRFADSQRPEICERVAKSVLVSPDSTDDVAAATALADRAVTGTEQHEYFWYFQLTKALAEYRSGHDDAALEWLDRMDDAPNIVSPSGMRFTIRAMANERLGRVEHARAALERAREIMTRSPDPVRARIQDVANLHDWVFFRALLTEAESQVGQRAELDPAGASSRPSRKEPPALVDPKR